MSFQEYTSTLSNFLEGNISLHPINLAIEELIAAAKEIQQETKVRDGSKM